MVKNIKEIQVEWNKAETNYDELQSLAEHEPRQYDYLAEIVAALCNITKHQLFWGNTVIYSQPRRLYWYACQYMTKDTNGKIADMTAKISGRTFSLNAVCCGANAMAELISNDYTWQRRWNAIKRAIQSHNKREEKPDDSTITINVPRNLRDKVKIEIQEI